MSHEGATVLLFVNIYNKYISLLFHGERFCPSLGDMIGQWLVCCATYQEVRVQDLAVSTTVVFLGN